LIDQHKPDIWTL